MIWDKVSELVTSIIEVTKVTFLEVLIGIDPLQ